MKKILLIMSSLFVGTTFAQSWNLTGNSGTNPDNNFIGTIDDKPIIFRTGNKDRFKIHSGPYVNGVVIGNSSALGTPEGGSVLEIVSALCHSCASRWAEPSDIVFRNFGSKSIDFHMSELNLVGAPTFPNTPDRIKKIKFTDEIHNSNLVIFNTGKVTVGTDKYDNDPDYIFYVKKGIKAEQIKVENPSANGWADYVFKKDYKLNTLEEVEKHIAEKGHLPNIPSAKEVEKNGINLGEMNAKLLEKIEELTLYSIEQNKQIQELKTQVQSLISNQK